jgi:predicted signal transduction protein with EAL and GGDEF domain
VAGRIKAACREDDIAARLGGDEFAVIAMSRDGDLLHSAENLARRLIEAISEPDEIDGRPVVVGSSIGIALVPAHGERIDEILRNADLALYRSKSEGRNRFQIYSMQMKAEADRRSALEIDLREAIWGDQLEVHYQPVVDIVSRRVVSVEALARWRHPTRGPISPTEFIPVAEQTGLIVELGNWVMLRACRDATQMPSHIKVAVNLVAGSVRRVEHRRMGEFRACRFQIARGTPRVRDHRRGSARGDRTESQFPARVKAHGRLDRAR